MCDGTPKCFTSNCRRVSSWWPGQLPRAWHCRLKTNLGGRNLAMAITNEASGDYKCLLCSFIYDAAQGCPEHGIAPGTAWEDVDEEWCCPDCGAGKAAFVLKDY